MKFYMNLSGQCAKCKKSFAINDTIHTITSWKQVTVDINGGSGTDSASNDYDINGDNDFSSLTTSYTSTQVTYTLTFDDEDHPDEFWDDFWDDWRQVRYNRTTDIESFTVTSSGVVFDDIWSNDKTFVEFFSFKLDFLIY